MNAWVTTQIMDTITRVQRRLDRISVEMEEMEKTMASLAAMVAQEEPATLRPGVLPEMERVPAPEQSSSDNVARWFREHQEDYPAYREKPPTPFCHPPDCPICEDHRRKVEQHRVEIDKQRHPLDMRVESTWSIDTDALPAGFLDHPENCNEYHPGSQAWREKDMLKQGVTDEEREE